MGQQRSTHHDTQLRSTSLAEVRLALKEADVIMAPKLEWKAYSCENGRTQEANGYVCDW